MLLLLHIVIAIGSLVYTGLTYLTPSKTGLRVSYYLVIATMVSGTLLVLETHAPLVSACMAGLAYLGVAAVGLVSARHRLATAKNKNRNI